jgi:nicotinate-nucleotide pyrophosphorylase (carboxylating)
VIAGLDVARCAFESVGRIDDWKPLLDDGGGAVKGQTILEIGGNARAILTAERVALNFLQRLSGIATTTRQLVKAIEGTGAQIADTRKTTPGLRALEKYAVRVGGGCNHRFGLYDAVLIKDNHIAATGSIAVAVERVRARAGFMMKIEVEVRSLEEVEQAIAAGADVIMLDNMTLDEMRETVKQIQGRSLVEASGNITEQNVRAVAETGVDVISVGAITHSARALDLSLKFMV